MARKDRTSEENARREEIREIRNNKFCKNKKTW